jgi:superfamily II DNA or RNA helicase
VAVTQSRVALINRFANARRFAVGATPEGRFDGQDELIKGVFGPVLVRRTFKEAVDEGAILMIKVFMVRVKFRPEMVKTYETAYKRIVFNNNEFAELVGRISSEVIPAEWQTLAFIRNENQARLLQTHMKDAKIGMDKLMKAKERKELFADMQGDKLKRCICSNIYSTGVTFPDLRAVINCDGGGKNFLSIQKPGRLAQVRPGKQKGYVIDFLFEPDDPNATDTKYPKKTHQWWAINRDCRSRIAAYREKEYEVEIVNNINEIKLT